MTMILVSNDDGISGPGLVPLRQALERVAEVTVIVPDRQWTASGHAKTMHKPLRIQEITLADGGRAYSSSGAPSDCVALAVLGFLPEPPDLVVSGINLGANVGHDITYSGTLAAAFEGTISGIPSIAASLDTYEDGDFRPAAEFVAGLAREVLARGLPKSVLLNVNIPNVPRDEIAGVEITRLGRRLYRDRLIKRRCQRSDDEIHHHDHSQVHRIDSRVQGDRHQDRHKHQNDRRRLEGDAEVVPRGRERLARRGHDGPGRPR